MYGAGAGVPGSNTSALDGAPSLVDNPRQLALERSQQTGKNAAIVDTVMPPPIPGNSNRGVHVNTLIARPKLAQTESRGQGGKRRIQPTLMCNGPLTSVASSASAAAQRLPAPRWADSAGAAGVGTVSEGFGSSSTGRGPGAATSRVNGMGGSGNSHKRPRTGGGSGQGGHFSTSRQQHSPSSGVVGVRQQTAAVVRLRSSSWTGFSSSSSSTSSSLPFPLVSPPELMPLRGASGSLVRQISGNFGAVGDGAFRPPPRLRKASPVGDERHGGGMVGGGSGLGLRVSDERAAAGDGDGESRRRDGVAVLECSALEPEFRGLPARRYTLVAVTRGGREAWRDYVAGTVTACCGNARVAAVGTEDGSVYVYDRSGTRCGPPLVVSPPVAYLECSDYSSSSQPLSRPSPDSTPYPRPTGGDQLMAISGDGDIIVWNLYTMTLTIKSSLSPLFRAVSVSSSSTSASMTRQSFASTPSPPGSPTSSRPGSAGPPVVGGGSGGGGGGKGTVSVTRAGVTPEGMPLVMLACPGAFGGSLQAFALHGGLGTWIRVADGRWVGLRGFVRVLFSWMLPTIRGAVCLPLRIVISRYLVRHLVGMERHSPKLCVLNVWYGDSVVLSRPYARNPFLVFRMISRAFVRPSHAATLKTAT